MAYVAIDQDRNPEDGNDFERVMEELKAELNGEGQRQVEIVDELWDSGKMDEMIEKGDFSDLPPEVRPEGYNVDDEGDPDGPSDEVEDGDE